MDTKRAKILIIDDEDIVLKSCSRVLLKINCDIETAYSGEEGLRYIEIKSFDIVITDLKMPGMGGMEVLRYLRDKKPEVTVIIFTGFATVETAREALKLGAFDYIPKPFTPEELRDVVCNALKARDEKSDAKMLDLMAIVSHELKSPISVVHTTADTLYKGYFGKLDAGQQKTIETILRNCQYLEDIIRNYIDLSKMEIDDLESFQKKINIFDDVIKPVLDVPEHANNIKNMPLAVNIEAKPFIQGDPNLLKIVVTNLVNNAIKYGRQGSEVRIDLFEKNSEAVFTIYNVGVGIPREDIEKKLFSKFGRLKQKGTEGVKGSGLGLYICKKIIEKHNGRICVESEFGKWVRFSLIFSLTAA